MEEVGMMANLDEIEQKWRGWRQYIEGTTSQLREEINRHVARNHELENKNAELQREIRQMKDDPEGMDGEITDLRSRFEDLRDENERLRDFLRNNSRRFAEDVNEKMARNGTRKRTLDLLDQGHEAEQAEPQHDSDLKRVASTPHGRQAQSGERELQLLGGLGQAASTSTDVPAGQSSADNPVKGATNLTMGSSQTRQGDALDRGVIISQLAMTPTARVSERDEPGALEKQNPASAVPISTQSTSAAVTSLTSASSSTAIGSADDSDELDPSVSVKLVSGIDESGSLEFCDTDHIPPDVKKALAATINIAKNLFGNDGLGWRARLASTYKCTSNVLRGKSSHWVEGSEMLLGRRTCFNQRKPCILLSKSSSTFVVLPIVPAGRTKHAMPGQDGFYINLIPGMTNRVVSPKHAVWSSKPATTKTMKAREAEMDKDQV